MIPAVLTKLKSLPNVAEATRKAIEVVEKVYEREQKLPLREIVREVAKLFGRSVDYDTSFTFSNAVTAVAFTTELIIDCQLVRNEPDDKFVTHLIDHAKLVEERAPAAEAKPAGPFLNAIERAVEKFGPKAKVIALNANCYHVPQLVVDFEVTDEAEKEQLADEIVQYLYIAPAVTGEVKCTYLCGTECREVTLFIRMSNAKKIIVYWDPVETKLLRRYMSCTILLAFPRQPVTEDLVKLLERGVLKPSSVELRADEVVLRLDIDFRKLAELVLAK